MKNKKYSGGFTFTELVISLFILLVIGTILISVFYTSRKSKNLDTITDGLAFTIEKAKNDTLAGKNAAVYGVHIASTTYTYFAGTVFDPNGANNKITEIPNGWQLATSTGNPSSAITFSRLSGEASANFTITIRKLGEPTITRQITVGTGGNISVIK